MIHIVFNESEVALMQKVIELDSSLTGEVLQIRDDFAVGPLRELDTSEGWKTRIDWWKQLHQGSPYNPELVGSFDDRETVRSIRSALTTNTSEEVWIWMAQNQHDVTGYFWLMPQLRDFQGRIMIIYLNNLPFINEKGHLFYPSWLHEIQPTEFLKAKKLARAITLSEFEVDPDEWKKIAEESADVRMLEGGKKIAGKPATFYDSELVKNVTPEWQKAWRVLYNTLNRMKIKTGDLFVMWRMRELIAAGKIEATGDLNKGWKDFDVRLPGANAHQADPLPELSDK